MTPARRLVMVLVLVAGIGHPAFAGDDKGTLLRSLGGAEVDWEAGTVTVQAGAAADLRLPGPDAARAAAHRQARAQAVEVLTDALRVMPLGGGRKVTSAVAAAAAARAEVKNVEYQSNGGVVLRLQVQFSDLTDPVSRDKSARDPEDRAQSPDAGVGAPGSRAAKSAGKTSDDGSIAIAVASMPLSVAPEVVVDGEEHTLGSAVYRMGEPPSGQNAVAAKKDKTGRLLLKMPPAEAAKLQGARAVIFVRSIPKR